MLHAAKMIYVNKFVQLILFVSHSVQLRPGGAGKSRPRGGHKEQQRKMARERQLGWQQERANTSQAWSAVNKALDLAREKKWGVDIVNPKYSKESKRMANPN